MCVCKGRDKAPECCQPVGHSPDAWAPAAGHPLPQECRPCGDLAKEVTFTGPASVASVPASLEALPQGSNMDDVASPDKALKAAFRSRSRHEPEGAGAGRKAVLAWQEAEHKACGPATAARPLRLDAAPASASVAADLGTGAPAAAAPASGQVPGSRSGGGHASGDTTPVFDREYLSDSGDSDDDTGPVVRLPPSRTAGRAL